MHEDVGHGISVIDTGYLRDRLAALYLLVEGDQAAIIETGTAHSAPRVAEVLAHKGLSPESVRYVIPTHVHLDHAGGASAMLELCPNAELVVHPRGARHMIDPTKLVASAKEVYGEAAFDEMYGEIHAIDESRVQAMEDRGRLALAGRVLEFRDTPGHAKHHFCIYDEASNGWFTGDTFGISYENFLVDGHRFLMPTTTPVQFDPDALVNSIELIMSYEPDFAYLTHFGAIRIEPGHALGLVQQIGDYRDIAEHHADAPDRVAALEKALTDYTLARLDALGAQHLDRLAADPNLKMDMGLNAQGIDVWLGHA